MHEPQQTPIPHFCMESREHIEWKLLKKVKITPQTQTIKLKLDRQKRKDYITFGMS